MTAIEELSDREEYGLLLTLFASTFLVFFQIFMVPPMLPRFAEAFDVSVGYIFLMVPVFLVPYGAAVLVYGPFSDHWGRRRLILASTIVFIVLMIATGLVRTAEQMIAIRIITALGISAIVPISLALIGDLYPFEERGRPLGYIFAGFQGGTAVGSSAGPILTPFIGWEGVFVGLGIAMVGVLFSFRSYTKILNVEPAEQPSIEIVGLAREYAELFQLPRGKIVYSFVFLNAVFHAGVYVWLGHFFATAHDLGDIGIGLAILGYGLPGMFLAPRIGHVADIRGRRWMIPAGLFIGGISVVVLGVDVWHVLVAAVLVATLSIGFETTQPLFAGVVTDLSEKQGLAMGLNVFALFAGYGIGSILFWLALDLGFLLAFTVFGMFAILLGVFSIPLFKNVEQRQAD